jgi:hypothetical protein
MELRVIGQGVYPGSPLYRHLLSDTATIEGGEGLPGFSLAITDIFPAEQEG